MSVGCCGTKPKVIIIATVKTLDAGIDTFTKWAVDEEAKIADDAVAKCKDSADRATYDSCVDAVVKPRRAPIDKAKFAVRLYGDALQAAHGAQTGDLLQAAAAATDALAACGISIGGAK
jgi:hypothetical protein